MMQRPSSLGISVIVSGSGVGGLMSALECWRRGCDVRILEKSTKQSTAGDSFTIGPTALKALRHWPFLHEQHRQIAYNCILSFHDLGGNCLRGPFKMEDMISEKVADHKRNHKLERHSRPRFHAMLIAQLEQLGMSIEYGKGTVDYLEDHDAGRAAVVLQDGSTHWADLIIAAEGVGGKSCKITLGHPVPAKRTGEAMIRSAYPVELALADPDVASFFPAPTEDGYSHVQIWGGNDRSIAFWRNPDEFHMVFTHSDDGLAEESWSNTVSHEQMARYMAEMPELPGIAHRVIRTIPKDQLIDYKLVWRDPQPKWTSSGGRVVQVGDAAHTFLPASGNGATQAMEDAVSLAACIEVAGRKEHIPDATRVHNLLRFERVSCLQAFGVKNREKNLNISKAAAKEQGKPHIHLPRWLLEHDPQLYARENYQAALDHLLHGTEFKNTNIPPGMLYRPWTIDTILEAQRRGEPTVFDGDWQ